MSQFEREDKELIALVNENHRASHVCRTIGVIVPMEEAERMAVQKARAARKAPDMVNAGLTLFYFVAVVAVCVAALV